MAGLIAAIILVVMLIIIIIVVIARKSRKSKDRFEGQVRFDNRIYNQPNNQPLANNANGGQSVLFPRSNIAEPNPYDSLGPCALSTFKPSDDYLHPESHASRGAKKGEENPYASLRANDMLKYSNFVELPKDKTDSLENGYMHMRGSSSSDVTDDVSKDGTYVKMNFDSQRPEEDVFPSNGTLISSENDTDPSSYVNNGYATHISLSK
ncbi:uncharacterized protein LOC117344866 [Pecten maximus]|uniref:uncharacterized protein LOC117344866 n=1 Tax=Pecten maximus TaxID=6579 RepID=UPI001457E74A|nr:uncharacterized protein LOC117344866 [Pecten maximus]